MELIFDEEIVLKIDEIKKLLKIESESDFPKYAMPLINLANRFSQATRPKIVGKMSELIKECPYRDFEGWKKWYLSRYPTAIEEATDKIMNMLENFKSVIEGLDRDKVRKWVEDLVLVKTYIGLRVQEPILSFFARRLNMKYRLAEPEEESRGIDGFIDEYAISIKPKTYEEKEKIAREIPSGDVVIYYDKDKENNIVILKIESLSRKGNVLIKKIKESFKASAKDNSI